MEEKIKRLRKDKIKAGILIVILIGCLALLTTVLLTATNVINIDKLSARVTSLNASVIDADSEVNAAASYDELTYKFNITKEARDEAVITGILTEEESKYARFKETSNSEVTNNGKQIVIRTTSRTTSSKPKITVIVSNAPYGTVINPSFTINSENPDNKNIITDPVTITSSSIEGTVKDEKNNLIGGLELSLTKDGEEIKRTYNDSDGKYVFSLPEEGNYNVKIEEEKYKVVRYEELTTNENKRILNIIVKEVTPFTLDLKKTINKLDLVIDGKKATFNYDDETKVIKNIKKASTIEGSIYYKIYIKNVGDVKGSLTQLKDILHKGLSFDETKNPGWELKDGNLYYTILNGKDIEVSETVEVNLVLDIEKTNEAKNYINEVVGKGETFKNVVYILDNNIYKEEYVIEGEKIDNITPTVENFGGWYTDRKHTNKYNFNNEVTKNLILYGKIENNKYDVTFIDKNPSSGQETIIETKVINEGETVDFPTNIPEHVGYTFKCFTLNDECINELEVREDTTLYTDYTVNNYTINYDYDGGSVSEDNPETYTVKDEITLHNPSKEGYTFLGWTGTDVTEPTIEVTIPRGSTGNRSYTAHFEIKRSTLTINPRGGSYQGDYGPIYFTEDYGTIKAIAESERRGYTFKRYNKVGGGIYNEGIFTFNDEDAELNAIYEINTYTISYDNITPAEKEALGNLTEYNVETETFELANPETRTDIYGYPSEDFLGWDDGSGNVSLTVTIPKGSIGNKTYTAVWRINQNEYRIIYDYAGGELDDGVTNIGTFTRETPSFTVNNPHRNGYNFTGWTGTGLEELTMLITVPTNSVGNRSYTANYSPIDYTISYDGITEEERAALSNPTSYNIETETFTLAEPNARKDEQGYDKYDFLGWDDGEGNVSINVTISKGSTGDRSYTARWKDNEDDYRITYDTAGGSFPEGVTNPTTYKRKTATFTLNNPSKVGYTFDGWSGTDIEGLSTEVTIPKGSVGNRNYVAHFTPISYTISYDGITEEERAALSNPTSYNIESGEIRLQNPGRRVDAQGLNSEDFVGWDDGSGNPSMQIIIPTGSMGNKTYIATWVTNEDPYGITYELNGGAYDPGVTNPSTYTRLTPTFTLNKPHKTGYDFDGWTTDEPGSTPILEVTIEKGSAGDKYYEANYSPITYTISYDNAGGTVSGNPVSYTIESSNITLNNPTKDGYIFKGWSGTGITDKSMNVVIPTGSTGNRSYTANFEKITYDIDYVLNGGTASNPSSYDIETDTFTLNNPTKNGYTFTGWSGTDLVGDDNLTVSITKGSQGDRSYEAHYSLETYTISYDYVGGVLDDGVTNPNSYTYESDTISFNNPHKTGYTFKNYTLEGTTTIISEIPKHSTGNKKLVANYDIDRFNVYYYNGEDLFASEIVDYNNTATRPTDDPVKAHNIFLYWSEDGVTPFDYDTFITEDKNLYAVYEEIVSPTISFDPSLNITTNKTWTCDNTTDENCGVTVTITSAANDYETYYKVGDGSYTLYTEPFKLYNNETVSAFSRKSSINSVETSEQVNNIDKINPSIDESSFKTKVASFSIKLTGNIVDNESGIKYYELYILDEDRELLPSDLPYTTSDIYPGNHDDLTIDFRFSGLINLTEYKMFVKAYDYVGNSQTFSIKAETTDYVARIIGRGNIPYSDESQWEKFESLQDAIDSCEDIQCTIQLNPEVVNESVEINEYQDITLDLDNKLLTSSGEYTVKINENGRFTLIDDSNEHSGKITNTLSKAIINNGRFTLGSGSTETLISLPTEYPVVEGAVIGLDNYGTFYFFDGYVKASDGDGHSAAVDNTNAETITQYPYNVISTKDGDMLVESLKKVDDPEARIKSVYYTKLNATTGESAISSSNNGTYENENVKLLSQIKQYGDYGFVYNPNEDSIRNASDASYYSQAISYVKLDLSNYENKQYLLLNTECNTLNGDYGYVAISEIEGDLSNKVINISGTETKAYRIFELQPKKIYYIYFGFVKNSDYRMTSLSYFKVNSASIVNNDTTITDFELIPNDTFYFRKEADGSYINTNNANENGSENTQADSYAMFDLTNLKSDLNLVINYDIDTAVNTSDWLGFVNITDDETVLPYTDTSKRVLSAYGIKSDVTKIITIPAGKISYLHVGYHKQWNHGSSPHTFRINKIKFQKISDEEDITEDNIHHNVDNQTPESNQTDDYYFEYNDYNPFVIEDSSGNGYNADIKNAALSENKTYYTFTGQNSFAKIDWSNINLKDYEESVYVEYSTTSTGNAILYMGSNKEKIGLGLYNGYIIVSNDDRTVTFQKPSNYSDGEKHYFLVTYKEGQYHLYFDGESLETTSNRDYWGSVNTNSYIATRNGLAYQFVGNIYQLRVFNKQILPENISDEENIIINLNPTVQGGKNYYINNNTAQLSSTAHSYLTYDLTNSNKDMYLKINYSTNIRSTDYAKIYVNDTATCPASTETSGLLLNTNSSINNANLIVKLEKNKINYVHFNFIRERWDDVNILNYFAINSVKAYEDYTSAELDGATTINTTNTSESIFNLPVARLNEDPSVVVMLKDITVTSPVVIPEEKNMVLDLNGHTLSSSVADYLINNKGDLTITDGKYSSEIINYTEEYENIERENVEKKEQYLEKLSIYEEYAGLCEGCEPSDEYKLDHIADYLDYFGIDITNEIFDYTGDVQSFTAPSSGMYQIQTWGASGGKSLCGGKLCGTNAPGGYSSGEVHLDEGETIYIYVGQAGSNAIRGNNTPESFNGGGLGTWDYGDDEASGAGGGATDIRLVSGNWYDLESLTSRIMVAGAGGGSSYGKSGGYGGGLNGGNNDSGASLGATQTTGYQFGIGKNGEGAGDSDGVAGGGGGYYGGVSYNSTKGETGSGGSGFISGHKGSVAVSSSTDITPRLDSENNTCTDSSALFDVQCSYHYSGKKFTNTVMKSGNEEMPTHDGNDVMTGNIGDGYAKITSEITDEQIEEIRRNLPKTYNVKTEPVADYFEFDSGNIIIPIMKDYFGTNVSYNTSNKAEISNNKIHLEGVTNNHLSEAYYNKKVLKPSMSGTFNVSSNSSYRATLYVGFATTTDLTTSDFVSYKTFDFNNTMGPYNFNIKYDGDDEVYFKTILIKTSGSGNAIVDFSNIYFDTYNIASNFSGLMGNITSGSYNIFLNNTGASLNLENAIVNLNKASSSAIVNRGKLNLGELSTINVNSASSKGIDNETTGDIESSAGKINVLGDNSVGLHNRSKDNLIEDLNIETTKNNQIAVNNFNDGDDITYNNLNISGVGTGFNNLTVGDVTINNSSISSTSRNSILIDRDTTSNKFTINSSNIYNLFSINGSEREVFINNCNLYSNQKNIDSSLAKLTINDSYINNIAGENIKNTGKLFINNSTIIGPERLVYNYADWQSSSYANINNSYLKLNSTSNIYAIDNIGTMEINDTNIDTIYGTNQTGIYNESGGYLNFRGNSNISSLFTTGINNLGYLKIGSNYDTPKNVYNFDFTGNVQEFVVPQTGKYKIEAWGSQGGYRGVGDGSQFVGGKGAYTAGEINLTAGEKLYVYVGSEGTQRRNHSYYGMPYSTHNLKTVYNGGNIYGGGATDISLSNEENVQTFIQTRDNIGTINSKRSESSYLDRIMVAGAGTDKYEGPDASSVGQALSNPNGTVSQVTGYAFGYSFDKLINDNSESGGAGYFGGDAGQGGTSYISGYLGAVAMNGSASNPKCTMEQAASDITCSYHNSGKIFTNTVMKAGNEEMPTHSGESTMRGNFGHGFAKITFLDSEVTSDTVTGNPSINASSVGVTGNGKVDYYDGKVEAQTPFYISINSVPDNYDLLATTNDGKTSITLKEINSEPYVASINGTNYTSLENAINAANDGDEILILDNLYEANSFEINKNITINLNGHSIKTYGADYLFINNADLKIYDNSGDVKVSTIYGKGLVYNTSNLEIDNIKLTDSLSSATIIYNDSNLELNSITFNSITYRNKKNSQFIYNSVNGNMNINNSNLTFECNDWYQAGIYIDNYGIGEIKDTTYTYIRHGYGNASGIVNEESGVLVLDNIKQVNRNNETGILVNYNDLTVKNSTTGLYVYNNKGTLTLENNTISSGGSINNTGNSLTYIKSGTYSNTINVGGSGISIDDTDNLYSFIMDDCLINSTINLNSSGIKWIKGGSIVVNADTAINNTTSAKLILGINDGHVDSKESTKPIITGNKNAIHTSDFDFVIDFYDGILTGEHSTDAIFETTETGYQIHRDYENNKEIEYLKQEVMFKDLDTNTYYYSINEVNNDITNGSINSGDTLQVQNDLIIFELDNPIEIPTGFTLNFDLNNHLIDQDDEELFINNGTLVIDDSNYQSDHNNGYGKIISRHGEIIKNNGTLTINSGEYESESHTIESTIIENNGILTINDGTYTKYYDYIGQNLNISGSIIENNGIANIYNGTYYSNGSYVRGTGNYLKTSTIFKNNINGVLTVTGGSYDGITGLMWNTYESYERRFINNAYVVARGTLIDNYGVATISDIVSHNSRVGMNNGTLTLENVTMNNIVNMNDYGYPSFINHNELTIIDSDFTSKTSIITNTGNMNITNSSFNRTDDNVYYENGTYYLKLYRTNRYDNSSVIYNSTSSKLQLIAKQDETFTLDEEKTICYGADSSYNCKEVVGTITCNDSEFRDPLSSVTKACYIKDGNTTVNINSSDLTNNGAGPTIINNGLININDSTLEALSNDTINNKKTLNVYGNSKITSTAAIGINNPSGSTLNLGKPAIEDGSVSQAYPLITGKTYGISNSGIFNFLDGYIKGQSKSINGSVTTNEIGYSVITPSDKIDDYYVSYLDQVKVIKNVQTGEEYFTISEAVSEASSGDTLQMISNDNVLNTASTIVIDKVLTLDLNGYTIYQGNNILFRNESTFTINDSNTSGNNQGKIEVASGTLMLDNYGDLIINGGTYNTSSGRLIIKNEALTQEEINNNVPEHTVTLQNSANLVATDNTILVENNGKMDIYNGAFLKNVYVSQVRNVITNYKELNIIDLNKDDDPNTTSSLTAPWIYSQGNTSADSGDIYNTSGATLNIYGGIFNNGGTYDQGSIAPDQVYIVYNKGTANIKNLDNYSHAIGYNNGTLNINNSHFYNMRFKGLYCAYGNVTIKDTIIETTETKPDIYGGSYELETYNANLDNVTIKKRDGVSGGKCPISFGGNSIVRNSNISSNCGTSNSIYNNGTLTFENTSFSINRPINNEGTIDFVNSNLTSSANGFSNGRILNISGTSTITSTNGIGINNTTINSVINIGTQDGVVDVTIPLIVGTTFGIDNSYTGAKINFYDGLVEGEGGPTAINGAITTAEGGYIPDYINNDVSSDGKYQVKLKDGSASVVIIAKVGNISFSSQSDPYVTATEALQLAINTAANSGRGVDLLQDITIDQNLTSSSTVTVYRNGHTETFEPGITATNITFTNGQAPLASLAKLLSNVSGSGDDENNIVIYEMNDGSSLTTTKTYKLYLEDNLIGLDEEEAGIYSYRGNTEELKPIKGKIYINNLTSGNYKLKSSDNKELDFSIDNDGNITGNIKKYNKTSKTAITTAIAELIIAIQTGMIRTNYLLLILPIIIIILLLLILIRRKQRKISL